MTLPAGEYYIGDLCYVIKGDDWDLVCKMINPVSENEDEEDEDNFGYHELHGVKFFICDTMWGDGSYSDQLGTEHSVDSGTIGCFPITSIPEEVLEELGKGGYSRVVFEDPFECVLADNDRRNGDGLIRIGHIEIDTDPGRENNDCDDYEGDDYDDRYDYEDEDGDDYDCDRCENDCND